MSHIHTDINVHDIAMLVLSRAGFASTPPEQMAAEATQKYIEVRRIILEEIKQHTNPGTMIIK